MKSGNDNTGTNPLISRTFDILLSCQQQMSYDISKEMKSFGITRQQYEVLKILHDDSDKQMNLKKVKSHLRENVPDISRIVQRLVEKQLISRTKQQDDKRNSSISINKKGDALLQQIEPVIKNKMADFFGVLTEQEVKELSRIISKVNQNKD